MINAYVQEWYIFLFLSYTLLEEEYNNSNEKKTRLKSF
jgi:hypothetical protein